MKNLLMVVVLGLSACATPEWREAHESCQSHYDREYPPEWTQKWVTRMVEVRGRDGRTETVPKAELERYDLAQDARNDAVQRCTASLCRRNTGNPDCAMR